MKALLIEIAQADSRPVLQAQNGVANTSRSDVYVLHDHDTSFWVVAKLISTAVQHSEFGIWREQQTLMQPTPRNAEHIPSSVLSSFLRLQA